MRAPEMRSVNGIQLLNLIRERGPLSRAALARLSHLSKPAVSEQIGRLLRLGLVVETGPGESSAAGGKRPTMVAFHAEAGRVAGIGIGPQVTQILTADLDGEIKSRAEIDTRPQQGPQRLIDRIERALSGTTGLRGLGIGVPGRVDCRSGVVLEAANVFGWSKADLRTPLVRRFGCPVQVDNDVNAALLAEISHGAAREVNIAVLLRVGTGVGAAVAIDRKIHHGANWAAGELAHLAFDRRPGKNPRGELELAVGSDRIARRVRAASRGSAVLRRLLRERGEIAALFEAAQQKDEAAVNIARDVAYHVSVAIAQQVLAYDPDVVLVSGEIFPHLIPEIRRYVTRSIPWAADIRPAEFDTDAVSRGAADAALIAVYEETSRSLSSRARTAAE